MADCRQNRMVPANGQPACPKDYLAGSMTLQLVRPDIRQSCILLAAERSRASHSPNASSAAAMISPTIAPRRLSPCSGSVIAGSALREEPAPTTPVKRLSYTAWHGCALADAVGDWPHLLQSCATGHNHNSMTLPVRTKR